MKRYSAGLVGLAVLWGGAGCGPAPDPAAAPNAPPATRPDGASPAEHHHGEGPHGGTVFDWGGGAYHLEFTVDHDRKEATVYVLGSDQKSPEPIAAQSINLTIDDPMTELELTARPLDGEAEGTSSRFVGTHDTIGIVKEFAGTVSGEVAGTPYTGEFKEEPHGADHKH